MYAVNYFRCFVILFSVLCPPLYAQDVCVEKTACRCEFPNGTGIDLTESAKDTFYAAQMYTKWNGSDYKLTTYYFHPCFDSLLTMNTSDPESNCGNSLALCRHYTYPYDRYEYMGSSNFSRFSEDGRYLQYFNGPSLAEVMLVCAETDDKLEVTSTDDPNNIVLTFYSRNSCLKQLKEVGWSLRSILGIIFFLFVIFCLVLVIFTKKLFMGATGIGVLEKLKLALWSFLPTFVKDGWNFTMNGFKPPARELRLPNDANDQPLTATKA